MPIFDYRCLACSHDFEKIVVGSDPPPITCPECESEKVVKVMSPLRASSIKITGGQRFLNNGKTDC